MSGWLGGWVGEWVVWMGWDVWFGIAELGSG